MLPNHILDQNIFDHFPYPFSDLASKSCTQFDNLMCYPTEVVEAQWSGGLRPISAVELFP